MPATRFMMARCLTPGPLTRSPHCPEDCRLLCAIVGWIFHSCLHPARTSLSNFSRNCQVSFEHFSTSISWHWEPLGIIKGFCQNGEEGGKQKTIGLKVHTVIQARPLKSNKWEKTQHEQYCKSIIPPKHKGWPSAVQVSKQALKIKPLKAKTSAMIRLKELKNA